jgi:hypothetical protein
LAEEVLTESKLEEIGQRALTFQRYIYRRAWGAYYALWAAAFAVFIGGNFLPLYELAPGALAWVPYAVIYGGIGWAAGIGTVLIFRNAGKAMHLRRLVNHPKVSSKWNLAWLWWVAFYVIAFVAFSRFPAQADSILYALLFTVEVYIYYWLKTSFPQDMPLEGKLALVSYGLFMSFGFLTSFFTADPLVFGVSLGATVVVWVFCALYAFARAPEELVDLRY